MGVLAIVLLGVLYLQFGRSSGDSGFESVGSAPRRRPPATSAAPPEIAGNAEKKHAMDKGSSAAVVTVVDERRWKSPDLADVVDYDPFAMPSSFPKSEVAAVGTKERNLATAAAAEDAKRLADAIAQLQRQLEELKQRGVQVIVREGDQYVAMIGDRTVHVGDEINGFTVTGIDLRSGVSVERKSAQ
jgi:hypothetical protein